MHDVQNKVGRLFLQEHTHNESLNKMHTAKQKKNAVSTRRADVLTAIRNERRYSWSEKSLLMLDFIQ